MNEILHEICEYYNVRESIITRNSRNAETVYYRQLFYYLSRNNTDATFELISKFISGKGLEKPTTATVIHGVKTIRNRSEVEVKVKSDLINLENLIRLPKMVIKDFNLLDYCHNPKYLN